MTTHELLCVIGALQGRASLYAIADLFPDETLGFVRKALRQAVESGYIELDFGNGHSDYLLTDCGLKEYECG